MPTMTTTPPADRTTAAPATAGAKSAPSADVPLHAQAPVRVAYGYHMLCYEAKALSPNRLGNTSTRIATIHTCRLQRLICAAPRIWCHPVWVNGLIGLTTTTRARMRRGMRNNPMTGCNTPHLNIVASIPDTPSRRSPFSDYVHTMLAGRLRP